MKYAVRSVLSSRGIVHVDYVSCFSDIRKCYGVMNAVTSLSLLQIQRCMFPKARRMTAADFLHLSSDRVFASCRLPITSSRPPSSCTDLKRVSANPFSVRSRERVLVFAEDSGSRKPNSVCFNAWAGPVGPLEKRWSAGRFLVVSYPFGAAHRRQTGRRWNGPPGRF